MENIFFLLTVPQFFHQKLFYFGETSSEYFLLQEFYIIYYKNFNLPFTYVYHQLFMLPFELAVQSRTLSSSRALVRLYVPVNLNGHF